MRIKGLQFLLSIGLLLGLTTVAQAQSRSSRALILRETKTTDLRALAGETQLRSEAQRAEAERVAREKGWPIRLKMTDGRVMELQRLAENGRPVYYVTHNANAAKSIGTDKVQPGGSAGLNLTGAGYTIGVWDGGRVNTTHQEFGGRVTQRDATAICDDHSTHVTGTAIATGVDPTAKGMAPGAKADAYDFNNDLSEMQSAAGAALLISNHSYGPNAGWSMEDTPVWRWYGDPAISPSEDFQFGFYTQECADWDNLARLAPFYLMVVSAGNDRGEDGPALGTSYEIFQNGNWVTATTPRPADGDFDCIAGTALAKNVLTVGAVEDLPNGYTTPSGVLMSEFSSWGPTDDGRIKPDVVANGVELRSANCSGTNGYADFSGTSMSAPSVAGSALLLQQHYANMHNNAQMRASTLKGLIIHTTDEAGPGPGPDYMYGWGLMNTARAADVITRDGTNRFVLENQLANGAAFTLNINAIGTEPLKVSVVWADPAGTPGAPALDPSTKMLVNDLDVRVTGNGNSHFPWVMNPASPSASATRGDNSRDNVEVVLVDNPATTVYILNITHKGTLTGGSQPFSLIISGGTFGAACAIPSNLVVQNITDNGAIVTWNQVSGATGYVVEYRRASNMNWSPISTQSNSVTFSNLATNTEYVVRVKTICNPGESAFSSEINFTTTNSACASPSNVQGTNIGANEFTLSWGAVPTATTYRVEFRALGDLTFNVRNTPATTLTLTGLVSGVTYEYRINAFCDNGEQSAFTTLAQVATVIPPCPAPTSVRENGVSNTTINVAWDAMNGAISYLIEYRKKGTVDFTERTAFVSSIVLSGLSPGTEYEIQVRTICPPNQKSDPSSMISVFTDLSICLPPAGLTANTITTSGATIQWAAVDGAIDYILEYRVSTDFNFLSETVTGTSFTLTGLSPGLTYDYRIHTQCIKNLTSNVSNIQQFTTQSLPCTTPTNLQAINITTTTATLTWSAVPAALSYRIEFRKTTDAVFTIATSVTNQLLLASLTPASSYEARVRSNCAAGVNSSLTQLITFSTPAPQCPTPTNVQLANLTSTSFNVTWDAMPTATGYVLEFKKVADASFTIVNATNPVAQITELTPNTNYVLRVKTLCTGGTQSGYTSDVLFTTLQETCEIPTGFVLQGVTTGSATLVWNVMIGATSYRVDFKRASDPDFSTLIVTENRIVLTNLDPGTDYQVKIKSLCVSGLESDFSSLLALTTTGSGCAAPTNIVVSRVNLDVATLTWTAAPNAAGYVVEYRRAQDAAFQSKSATGVSVILTALSENTRYFYRVRTNCNGGSVSAFTALGEFTTASSSCFVPIGFAVLNITTTSAFMVWNPVFDAVGYKIEYEVQGTNDVKFVDANISFTILNGLSPGVTYTVRVKTSCGDNTTSAFTADVPFTTLTVCATPGNIVTEEVTASTAVLSWPAAAGATGYTIDYNIVGNSQVERRTTDTNRITLIGLQLGVQYQAKVASNCSGNRLSDFSQPVFFTTQAPCAAPTNFQVDNITGNSARLNWTTTPNALTYLVEYKLASDFTFQLQEVNAPPLTLLTLLSDTLYQARVTSRCGPNEESLASDLVEFRTTPGVACAAPADVAVAFVDETSADLAWTAVSGAQGYTIEYRIQGQTQFQTATSTAPFVSLQNLTANRLYEYHVRTTCNGNQVSAFSDLKTFITVKSVTCEQPRSLVVGNITLTGADFSWAGPANAEQYSAELRKVGDNGWGAITISATGFARNNLTPGTDYEFRVKAFCFGGDESVYSDTIEFQTEALCAQPAGLSAGNPSANFATITWTNSKDAVEYVLYYKKVTETTWRFTQPVKTPRVDLTPLTPATEYEVAVQAFCSNGASSEWSETITFRTANDVQGCPTPEIEVTDVTPFEATVRWTSEMARYEISYRPLNGNTWNTAFSTKQGAFTLTNLTPNTTYDVRVRNYCSGLLSNFSNQVRFTTSIDASNCAKPTNLAASNLTVSTAEIFWVGPTNAMSFDVQYRKVDALDWIEATGTLSRRLLIGLEGATVYEVRVRTRCTNGNTSPFTNSILFVTENPFSACPAPFIASSNLTATSVKVTWMEPMNQYEINFRPVGAQGWTTRIDTKLDGYTILGLTPETEYEIKVRNYCGGLFSAFSNSVFIKTLRDDRNCTAPSGASVGTITTTTAVVGWNLAPTAVRYEVQYRPEGENDFAMTSTPATNTILSGLKPNTTYEFAVRTVCANGNSSLWTDLRRFRTLDDATSCATPDISLGSLGEASAEIRWVIIMSEYELSYHRTGESEWIAQVYSQPGSYLLEGLQSDTEYEVRVRNYCGGNFSAFSNVLTFHTSRRNTLCDAPTGLAVSNVTSRSATFSWRPVTGAKNYEVYYQIEGSDKFVSVSTPFNAVSVTDLTPGQNYVFRVKTVCTVGGESSWTAFLGFRTLDDGTQCPTTTIAVGSLTNTTAELTWPLLMDVFEVNYRRAGESEWKIIVGSAARRFVLTGLQPQTTYQAKLRNYCGGNYSVFSNEVSFTTPNAVNACAKPAGVAAGGVTTASAMLSWTVVPGAAGFEIQLRQVGAQQASNLTTSTNTLQVTGLTPATQYEFRLRTACANEVFSDWTDWAKFTTGANVGACSAPFISTGNVTPSTAEIRWTDNLTAYEVSYRRAGAAEWLTQIGNGQKVYALTSLTPATAYEARLRNYCSGTFSDYSNVVTFTTLNEVTNCATPSELRTTNVSLTFAVLSWKSQQGVSNFNLTVRPAGVGNGTTTVVATNTYFLQNLSPETTYEFKVQAVCGNGSVSLTSDWVRFSTLSNTNACPAPQISVGIVSQTTARITWSLAMNTYEVSYRRVGVSEWVSVVGNEPSGYTLLALQTGTAYDVRVRNYCNGNYSDISNEVRFATLPQGQSACATPNSLTAGNVGQTSATLGWSPVADAFRYELAYRAVGSVTFTTIDVTSGSSLTLANLAPETGYEVRVRTRCNANNTNSYSEWSSLYAFATATAVNNGCPKAVLSVQVVGVTDLTITGQPLMNLYEVTYREAGGGWSALYSNSFQRFTLGGLKPGTTYEVRVRNFCSPLFSEFSNTISVTTKSGRTDEKQLSEALNLSVYPNPNDGHFAVSFEARAAGEAQVRLQDLSGRTVWLQGVSISEGAQQHLFQPSEVSSGVYILELVMPQGGVIHQRLVIR